MFFKNCKLQAYARLYDNFKIIYCQQFRKNSYDIKIGNIVKSVSVPKNPNYVPVLYIPKSPHQNSLHHLQWMMKKDILGQDIFLIGAPGPLKARVVFQYLELIEREVEYVALSRDTTENDLKQRREIIDGTAHYVDQSAVKAAINGSFLVLDGVEKVERNVLPVLNNLLENREMQLEDGRFLIAPDRYDKLLLKHSQTELDNFKLVRVSENFRVVALGLPVPQFKGNPLDPPFRSRFQARHIQCNFDEQYTEFCISFKNIENNVIKNFLSACHSFLSEESAVLGLTKFPIENIPYVFDILNKIPSLPVGHTFKWLYPMSLILSKSSQGSAIETLKQFSIEPVSAKIKCVVSKQLNNENQVFTHSIEFKSKTNSSTTKVLGHKFDDKYESNYVPNAYHENILADMCLTHLSHDFCLVGNRGCGKAVLVRKFASLFNYPTEMIMLYNDMTARDLLQQRVTDDKGNTLWIPSQIVHAAEKGKLLILDGLHRLHTSTLSVLQRLIHDREIQLYDGTRLLRSDRYNFLKAKLNLSDEQMKNKSIKCIHPSFRIVALAEPPKIRSTKDNWLNPQVLSLFLFHEIHPLSMNEEKHVILSLTNCPSNKIDTILDFTHKLRKSKDDSLKSVSASFSTRQLVRMAKRLQSFPHQNVYNMIKQSCLFEFLPQLTKQSVESLLENSTVEKFEFSSSSKKIYKDDKNVYIGNTFSPVYDAGLDKFLVPDIIFYDNPEHIQVMEAMLQDFILGEHLLLVGNQGVGKNKITDRFLHLLNRPREYIQLHRDTTVQSLTQQPTVKSGKIVYEDSPLLKAVQFGRVLVVDEADKAPTHVTSILKALVVSGEMFLSDGRRIVHHKDPKAKEKNGTVIMHPDFRMIVLANRPGFPFLGNDFFSTLGDIFSCHAVENPSLESEVAMLHQYGPNVPKPFLHSLANLFSELRSLSDAGLISYPYSTREIVNIIKHLDKFPDEGLPLVLKNVFDFDNFNSEFKKTLAEILNKFGIPAEKQLVSVKVAKKYKLPELIFKSKWKFDEQSIIWEPKFHKLQLGKKYNVNVRNISVDAIESRAAMFSELQSSFKIPLYHNNVPLDLNIIQDKGSDIIYVTTANPISVYRVNTDKKYANLIDLSSFFPTVRNGFKPKIFSAPLKSDDGDMLLLHENLTNQTFLVNVKEGFLKTINICSLFDEAISKINNIISLTANKNFVLRKFPSKEKVLLFIENGQKIIILNFKQNLTCQINLPEITKNILIINENCLLISCEMNTFVIDLLDTQKMKVRILKTHIDSNIAINSIHSENTNQNHLSLMSSPEDYACKITGSFDQDEALVIHGFPRERVSYSAPEHVCISSQNQQIFKFVLELPRHVAVDSTQNSVGFLEIVNLKDSTYCYIDACLPYNASSFANWLANTSKPYLLMCLSEDEKLMTVDIKGCIRKWETSDFSLAESFKKWKRMAGLEDDQQLTIQRIDKNKVSGPKHGKVDPTGAPHVGGNTWAGGTGGRDTAGLGGRGGPYRLDAGHNIYQVPDHIKEMVPPEVTKAAREMGRKAYKEKLKEIQMSEFDAEVYDSFLKNVEKQVKSLLVILDSLQAKSKERQWLRHQTSGELDDTKLIEGITGEKSIYRKRGLQEPEMGCLPQKPKLLRLVVDVSGSMYRFNGHDHRLQRELESVVLLMEAFVNYKEKFLFEIVGHSGEEYCLHFSSFDKPPKNKKERLQLLRNMIAHTQFCASGDNTLEATEHAIKTITKTDADEYFVIIMSDANFDRYGISPASFAKLLVSDPKVNAFAIFIGSLGDQAAFLQKQLPAGRGFMCFDSSDLTQILQKIFTSALLRE